MRGSPSALAGTPGEAASGARAAGLTAGAAAPDGFDRAPGGRPRGRPEALGPGSTGGGEAAASLERLDVGGTAVAGVGSGTAELGPATLAADGSRSGAAGTDVSDAAR